MGKGQVPVDQVNQAISVGFSHIDTAQAYGNELEAGTAIRESRLEREEIYAFTKYSAKDGSDVQSSIRNSLRDLSALATLGLSYVDLYLIHHPRFATPDIPTAWKELEKINADGLAKLAQLPGKILVHPHVYSQQASVISYASSHGIVTAAYSSLTPITKKPRGPVDAPVSAIATRLGVTPDQVILAWIKEKLGGGVVVTTTSKKERLEGYLNAGELGVTH
ncbi:hypothetical protein PILCRDRAFT_8845 [Piloderma croceum F 1598]|uniref:NADP-dependent oxidoreductase domain-containing protein n=1 Tax=Piloderma croceum (strain F 1598) TaxID=765440 RepID=A0A0C3B4M3_PILCF|nr:hypothetical protein PILCRDRAFT_8845 [Piloderma croceum F 1598]